MVKFAKIYLPISRVLLLWIFQNYKWFNFFSLFIFIWKTKWIKKILFDILEMIKHPWDWNDIFSFPPNWNSELVISNLISSWDFYDQVLREIRKKGNKISSLWDDFLKNTVYKNGIFIILSSLHLWIKILECFLQSGLDSQGLK